MANTIWINNKDLLYIVTVDGVQHKIICNGRLDYKAVCRKYYREGAKSVNIVCVGRMAY